MTLSVTLTLIVAIGFVLLLVLQWRDLRQRVSVPVRWVSASYAPLLTCSC
jgi:hypothetical protein